MSLQVDIDLVTTAAILIIYSVAFYFAFEVRKYGGGLPRFWKLMILGLILLAAHSLGYAIVDMFSLAPAADVAIIDDLGHVLIALLFLVSLYYLSRLWKVRKSELRTEGGVDAVSPPPQTGQADQNHNG